MDSLTQLYTESELIQIADLINCKKDLTEKDPIAWKLLKNYIQVVPLGPINKATNEILRRLLRKDFPDYLDDIIA
jgi:hypothetical protein